MTTEFPGNSKNPQAPDPKKPKVEPVVSGEVTARKKPLGKRLKDLLIGGDSKSVLNYVIMDVIIPQAKDMITEAASQGFERLVYGESRPSRGRFGSRGPGPSTNQVNYNRLASRGNNPIGRSIREERTASPAQARMNTLDDMVFATRVEADTVLEHMYDLLREYDQVTVADLYSLVGWTSNYVDQNWGWSDLTGSRVERVRSGYVLNLPKPVGLD